MDCGADPFIGRKRELDQLQEEWSEKKAALLILYGRRRIGKTRLLTHWIETSGARVLYWCQPNLIPGSTSLIFTGPV